MQEMFKISRSLSFSTPSLLLRIFGIEIRKYRSSTLSLNKKTCTYIRENWLRSAEA